MFRSMICPECGAEVLVSPGASDDDVEYCEECGVGFEVGDLLPGDDE
jgi:Zn-finger nucleic acid-binding protein